MYHCINYSKSSFKYNKRLHLWFMTETFVLLLEQEHYHKWNYFSRTGTLERCNSTWHLVTKYSSCSSILCSTALFFHCFSSLTATGSWTTTECFNCTQKIWLGGFPIQHCYRKIRFAVEIQYSTVTRRFDGVEFQYSTEIVSFGGLDLGLQIYSYST